MLAKVIDPLVGLFIFVAIAFWQRISITNRALGRARMRLFIGLGGALASEEFAVAWHNEISSAWRTHPELTFFITLLVFSALFVIAPSRTDLTAMLSASSSAHHQKEVV